VPYTRFSAVSPAGLLLSGVLLALLAAAPARAEQADRDQPMNIEADNMVYEDQKQLSTFTGRVVVTKGTIVLRGARLQVRKDADGNQFGTMSAEPGQRAFFRQKRDGVDEFIEGEGETIDYDGKAGTVRIKNRAEVRRLTGAEVTDVIKGALIVYDNTTEVYTVDGARRAGGAASAAQGKRVQATIAPRDKPASAPARGASAPAAAARLRPSEQLPAPEPDK